MSDTYRISINKKEVQILVDALESEIETTTNEEYEPHKKNCEKLLKRIKKYHKEVIPMESFKP